MRLISKGNTGNWVQTNPISGHTRWYDTSCYNLTEGMGSLWLFELLQERTILHKQLHSLRGAYMSRSTFFFFLCRAAPVAYGSSQIRVKLELQLLAYTTATATQDLSYACNLHHSSWQHWILNPLSEARDQTHILMDTSQVSNLLSHNGNSQVCPHLETQRLKTKL